MEAFVNEALNIVHDIHLADPILDCGHTSIERLKQDPRAALREADAHLRVFPFKDVKNCWRRLFTDASIVCAVEIVKRNWITDIATLARPQKQHEILAISSDTSPKDITRGSQEALVTAASLEKAETALPEAAQAGPYPWLTRVVEYLDTSLIMTGGYMRENLIQDFFQHLDTVARNIDAVDNARALLHNLPIEFPRSLHRIPSIQFPLRRSQFTIDAFQSHLDTTPVVPIIIENAIDHWPAMNGRSWRSPRYLLDKTLGGRRLVPIETGRSYTDDGWGQKIITFKDFLSRYIFLPLMGNVEAPDNGKSSEYEIAYLAQHDLFAQIPSLRKDISIPDICFTIPPPPPVEVSSAIKKKVAKSGHLQEPLVNAWFGPAGTVSPLHTDPYHNILCQVVGKKYIRLYSPAETSNMEPRGEEDGIDMSNTSKVPVEVVEMGALAADDTTEGRWDNFENARYYETILSEGECLYIPIGWWHYVRGLTVSFSVSFWWT